MIDYLNGFFKTLKLLQYNKVMKSLAQILITELSDAIFYRCKAIH